MPIADRTGHSVKASTHFSSSPSLQAHRPSHRFLPSLHATDANVSPSARGAATALGLRPGAFFAGDGRKSDS
eukprot:48798-Eustigmatos_ZCMA.PRE.1